MTLAELKQLIAVENSRLRAKFPHQSADPKQWALAQAVKVMEELGELCAELLGRFRLQRSDHPTLADQNHDRLSNEFADVVITTFLVAETMGIDMESALRSKFSTLQSRHAQSATTTSTHGTVAKQESETVPSN